jgi:hypothetical protein
LVVGYLTVILVDCWLLTVIQVNCWLLNRYSS